MTIRRKLTISNICMIVIPAFLSLLFALFLLHTVGYRYWDSLEDMFQDQNAVYSAQSIIYSSKADFFHEEWAEYARVEDGQRVLVTKNADKMKEMDQELKDLGYHFRICIDGPNFIPNVGLAQPLVQDAAHHALNARSGVALHQL